MYIPNTITIRLTEEKLIKKIKQEAEKRGFEIQFYAKLLLAKKLKVKI